MRRMILASVLTAIVAGLLIEPAIACGRYEPTLTRLAGQAIAPDSETAKAAIDALRRRGSEGLAALLDQNREIIARYAADPSLDRADPEWRRLAAAVDAVSAQRDAVASMLFWHTDMEAALKASRDSGRPILSLRLLGKLTDELSCANSRFFRTTLYANVEVSQALRERFVLHWQSVRPVPKVTIDFGDGRTMEGTVTGNSIHYILDSDGRVIDALPGLYGPQAFLRGLHNAERLLAEMKSSPAQRLPAVFAAYHTTRASRIAADWRQDLARIGRLPQEPVQRQMQSEERAPIVRAVAANNIAQPKGAVERPLLASVLAIHSLANATDDAVWGEIARLHATDAQLDAASVALIRAKNPAAGKASELAISKRVTESPLVRLVRNFQHTIAIDAVRNEYTFHRQIHEWLAESRDADSLDVNRLNERIYAELFLTPSSDPWLGLLPADTYTAIENNGVHVETSAGAGGR